MTFGRMKIKKLFLISLFILSIMVTSLQIFPSNYFNEYNHNNFINNEKEDLISTSDGYLSDYYITGSGDSQDVRIYAVNDSYSINHNQNFDIPSLSDTDTAYLSYGNFNFTFQNNYTTDYILENTSALNAKEFISFDYDETISSISNHTGNVLDPLDLTRLVTGTSQIRFEALNGIINVSIAADFSGTSDSWGGSTLNFNRELILGLITSYTLSSSKNTYLTLKMFDISDSNWKTVVKSIFIKQNTTVQDFENRIINENLEYINMSNVNKLQFYFENTTDNDYTIRFTKFNIFATYGFDVEITDEDYVALEFDLKGKNTTVNGFYAWIRTLNVSLAASTILNISLYEANTTIARTVSNLEDVTLEPNYNKMIDSFTISNYVGDNLTYFKFNTANTVNLKLYNYFIEIKSNSPDKVYSLVGLPRDAFGDPDNTNPDHQLRISDNYGASWKEARNLVPSSLPYTSERLDASSFKVNVTRGYMPSDFWNSENDNLNIQNITLENQIDKSAPYKDSSYLTWGLGTWDNLFTIPISAAPSSSFNIDLNWNKTDIKGFEFNVTYSVKAYWLESTTTTYNVTYDGTPNWKFTFDLSLTDTNFNNWNFLEFWFVYPNYFDALNLTNPDDDEMYFQTSGESPDIYKTSYKKLIVNNTLVNGIDGIYRLKLISPNLVHETHSFINYGGTFWETNGFMFGDDMTASVDIKDISGNPPKNGDANVKLFYPENPGGQYPGGERNDLSGVIMDDVLRYDFNNDTLLQVRDTLSYFGNYYLGFFWTNGSAIGCKKLKLYIDSYNVELNDFFYEPELGQNILSGGLNLTTIGPIFPECSMLIGIVNDTLNKDFYPVKHYDIDEEYLFDIGSVEIPILLKNFLQNETILNPDEDVNIKVTLQNNFELSDVDIKIKAQLLSLANEEWIIDEVSSTYKTLKLKGDPLGRDTQEFSIDFTVPTLQSNGIWLGENAPVRKGGVLTKITILIKYQNNDIKLGTYKSGDYSLIVNSTQADFDGYILSLKYNKKITGTSILKPFEREECIYLPDETTFLVNIYDENYMSSYNDFIASFSLKENSRFLNITTFPESPISGQDFNLSAILATEFEEVIPFKNVTLQYYNTNTWENISSQISGSEGQLNFEIEASTLNREDQYLFRLSWLGDTFIMRSEQNITIDLLGEENDLNIVISTNVPQLFQNRKAAININLKNTGTSLLYISESNFSVLIQPNLAYDIVKIDYLKLNRLQPNETAEIIIEIEISAINQVLINISIEAQNIVTKEYIIFQASKNFIVYNTPLEDYFIPYLTLLIIGLFIVFWLFMYTFVKKLIRRIETPIGEPAKKKPKRGKYIKVSELEKIPEKKEPKTTDLDTLLEEEGFKDKKKK